MKLPYPLLSDFPELKVIRAYGVLNERTKTTARRSFFVIDRQGVIRKKWVPENPAAVFSSETLLEGIQEVAGKP